MITIAEAIHRQYAPTLEVPGVPDIHLRVADGTDALELFDFIQHERNYLEEYQGWVRDVRTLEHAERYVNTLALRSTVKNVMQYRIVKTAANTLIGTVTVFDHDKDLHAAKFGYWLSQGEQGKGYAIRSTEVLLHEAKAKWGLTRADATIAVNNRPSERLAGRLGCTITGIPYEGDPKHPPLMPEIMNVWSKQL